MARTKYNVDKRTEGRTYEGIVYDSAVEMRYYRDYIVPRMRSGEITDCKRQVDYILQDKFCRTDTHGKKVAVRAIHYLADYEITWRDGSVWVIDIKGFADATAKIKRKLFWYKYPDKRFMWICWSARDGGWIEYEDLQKARAARRRR